MDVVRLSVLLCAFVLTPTCLCGAGVVHFVVAERDGETHHGDSFLLPLADPLEIAHARDLVLRGPDAAGGPLVFAEVVPGGDGINRNVLADGEPLWNWHVSIFEGFADGGIELVDGWPSLVEANVAGWMANTRRDPDDPDAPGHIGFWGYTVVAELDAVPPVAIPLPAAGWPGGALIGAVISGLALRARCRPTRA